MKLGRFMINKRSDTTFDSSILHLDRDLYVKGAILHECLVSYVSEGALTASLTARRSFVWGQSKSQQLVN